MRKLLSKVSFMILISLNLLWGGNLLVAHQSYYPTSARDMEIVGNEIYLMSTSGLDVYNLLTKHITNHLYSYGEHFNAITTDGHYIYMLVNNEQIVVIDALNKPAYSLVYAYDYYPPLDSFSEDGITPNLIDIKYSHNKLILYLAYAYHYGVRVLDASNPLHVHYVPKYHKDLGNIVTNDDDYCYYIQINHNSGILASYSLSSRSDLGTYRVGGSADFSYITAVAENDKYLYISFRFSGIGTYSEAFDIVDKSNPANLRWIKYVQKPLIVKEATNNYLIGEENGNVSIWDISSSKNPKEVYTIKGYNFGSIYKIIAKNNKLYVLSHRGLDIFQIYQYDPTLINHIKPISNIGSFF